MNKAHLLELKRHLEGVLEIINWEPSYIQLEQIREGLNKLPLGVNVQEVRRVVYGIYKDPIQVWVIKGLDTSRAVETLIRIKAMQEEIKNMEQSNASTANNKSTERKD
ncbi:TPA: hypothetical protein ACGPMY_004495 [Yersinia enterocolitica]